MVTWVEQDIDLKVIITTQGPQDPPGDSTSFDVTPWVRGAVSIARGRNDELSQFPAGSCTFNLANHDRRFDPARSLVVLELPGTAAATATTPDTADLVPDEVDARICLSMDDWTPGGFGQWLVGQYPNVAGNNSWVLLISANGMPALSWSTDGTNLFTRTSTKVPAWANGSTQCLRATLLPDNGSGQHVVTFYTSDDDGRTWTTLDTVTTGGTTSVFNSTASMAIGGALALAGQVRWMQYRNRIGGALRASVDFGAQEPGDTSFVDDTGLTWTVNSTASIRYDDDASPVAAILRPLRRVQVVSSRAGHQDTLFVGWVDEWPTTWDKTTGLVPVTAYDITGVLAAVEISDLGFTFDVDRFDQGYFGGDLGEEYTGERIETLVSMAGFGQSQFRVIDRGVTRMPAKEDRGDILSAAHDAAAAEDGFFFISRAGVITFRDAHARIDEPRMRTSQAHFRDGDHSGFDTTLGLTKVFNHVTRSRAGGDAIPQNVKDDVSIAQYGRRMSNETLEVLTDGEAYARASFFLQRYSRPLPRPGAIVIKPARRKKLRLYQTVVELDLLDRVTVDFTPLGIPPTARYVGLVEQLNHVITKDDWVTTIAVSLVDVDDTPGYFTFDDDLLGEFDGFPFAY